MNEIRALELVKYLVLVFKTLQFSSAFLCFIVYMIFEA